MPKRIQKIRLEEKAKIRKKSICVDNSPQLSKDKDEKDENEGNDEKPINHMHYIPSNQNNEVERLLLHNSALLLHHVDHSGIPAFNVGMWPQKNSDMLTYYPSCAFSVPRPIYLSQKQCEKIDICYRRTMNRYFFKNRIRMTRTCCQTALKSNKNIRQCMKDNIYHYSMFELAERVYMQPDPFFQSSYDFYFTGGNLCVLSNEGHILHAGGEKLQEIHISEFPAVGEHSDTNSLRSFCFAKSSEDCEIFEYQPLLTSLDKRRQNAFITRQRNLITFNYVNENKETKMATKFQTEDTPFISFAQSERNINNFIITTMKQHARLYDLSGTYPTFVKLFDISPKKTNISWNTVKPWRENTFLYANEKEFFTIDIRATPKEWLKDVTVTNNDLSCDHVSALMPSAFKNLFYVATNHKLQCLDIRYLKKSAISEAVGGVCRWTHQMNYAPLMMDTFRLHQNEYIALSSPIADDLHICELFRDRNDDGICLDMAIPVTKHVYSSPCLPYQPPTLLECYEHARLSGKCLRVESSLETRIKCCTTGMKFFKNPDNSNNGVGVLLTSNSNGDIFARTLSKREDNETEERCNKHSDEIMSEFEQKLSQQTQQTLYFTEIKNMKGLRKVLLCESLSAVPKFDFNAMDNEYNNDDNMVVNNAPKTVGKSNPKRLHMGRWQKSLSTLHSYKDALVTDLLSIWDIDMFEEHNIRIDKLPRNVKTDPTVKVENWLKQNDNISPPPMLSIPTQEIITYTENNLSNLVDNTFNLTETTVNFEKAVHSTQVFNDRANISTGFDISGSGMPINDTTTDTAADKLKSKKKAKKYVKGF